MNVFDLIILAILAALTLRGIWKGMVSQIVSVASFFVCWIVASRFGSFVAPTIPLEAPWNQVAAMAIVFLITLVAVRFLHALLEKIIKSWHLAKLNSLSGGILGFAKGLLLCMILTFFAVMVSETTRDMVFNAKTGPQLVRLITQIGLFVPKDSYEFVHAQLAQFQEKVDAVVPGQEPETLQVQSSEAVKRVLAQLHEAEMPSKASSLVNAISRWWNGTQVQAAEFDLETAAAAVTETVPRTKTEQSAAASYTPLSAHSSIPSSNFTPPVMSQTVPQAGVSATTIAETAKSIPPLPHPALPQSTGAEQFFVQRSSPAPASALQPIATPLAPLAPLTEKVMSPESGIMPSPIPQWHVGSEQLLRNSSQTSSFGNSAKTFQK